MLLHKMIAGKKRTKSALKFTGRKPISFETHIFIEPVRARAKIQAHHQREFRISFVCIYLLLAYVRTHSYRMCDCVRHAPLVEIHIVAVCRIQCNVTINTIHTIFFILSFTLAILFVYYNLGGLPSLFHIRLICFPLHCINTDTVWIIEKKNWKKQKKNIFEDEIMIRLRCT